MGGDERLVVSETIPVLYSILITVVSGLFVLAGSLLSPVISNWINVRKENRNLKREEEKQIKEKRSDFQSAYLVLLKAKSKIDAIKYLIDNSVFDTLIIGHQIEDIGSKEIEQLNRNILLNDEERKLAKEFFYLNTVEHTVKLNLELIKLGKLVKEALSNVIKHIDEQLKKLEDLFNKTFGDK